MMLDLLFGVLRETSSLLTGYPFLLFCAIVFGILYSWVFMWWSHIMNLKLRIRNLFVPRPDFFRHVEIAEIDDKKKVMKRSYLKINCRVLDMVRDVDLKYLTEHERRFVNWYRYMLTFKPTSMVEFALAYDQYFDLMDSSQMDICAAILEMHGEQVKKDA